MRKFIVVYLYNIYNTENISSNNGHNAYAIDESIFTHHNNEQLWVVEIVSSNNKSLFRCNYTNINNSDNLQRFITNYI